MEQQNAIQILVQVALLAQSKGVLTLEEAVLVKQAIDVFVKKEESDQQEVEEVK